MTETFDALDKAWRGTCRVLFGEDIGSIGKYQKWISEYMMVAAKRKSSISGKDVLLESDRYRNDARFISSEEITVNKPMPLGINDIKDIDSILQAIEGKYEYTGNRHLGNCSFVENSDNVIDSHYVLDSANVQASDHAYSSFMIRRGSRDVFGAGYLGEGEFLIRVVGTFNSKRCFESFFVPDSSDIYCSHQCFSSHELLFCFGQRNASYKIGNLQLEKSKYLDIKAKLIPEIAAWLKKEGSFPSLMEMAKKGAPSLPKVKVEEEKTVHDMKAIEKGFASTFKIIFNSEPSAKGIREYEKWLERGIIPIREASSPFGTKTFYADFSIYPKLPRGRLVKHGELMALGKISLDGKDVQNLGALIGNVHKIAYFSAEVYDGNNFNYIDSPLVYHGVNCYRTYDLTHGEHSGVCFQPLNSKYTYGCNRILESQFAIKCHNSAYLTRCFELDSCSKCSDSYFCHNSENLSECMFCFNAKNLKYAIGNIEVGREKYLEMKKKVLAEISAELENTHNLKYDIYNIGCAKQ